MLGLNYEGLQPGLAAQPTMVTIGGDLQPGCLLIGCRLDSANHKSFHKLRKKEEVFSVETGTGPWYSCLVVCEAFCPGSMECCSSFLSMHPPACLNVLFCVEHTHSHTCVEHTHTHTHSHTHTHGAGPSRLRCFRFSHKKCLACHG